MIDIEDPAMKGPLETRMSDYRNVEGRMESFSMLQVMNGNPVAEMKFGEVEFNVPLDDAIFKIAEVSAGGTGCHFGDQVHHRVNGRTRIPSHSGVPALAE